MKRLWLFLLILWGNPLFSLSQKEIPSIVFTPHEKQVGGFSSVPNDQRKDRFPWVENEQDEKQKVPVKVLVKGETDWVKINSTDSLGANWNDIDFYFGKRLIIPIKISPFEAYLRIDYPTTPFEIGAYFNDKPIAQLRTLVIEPQKKKVILVPLMALPFNNNEIRQQLDVVFSQANINWEVVIDEKFQSKVYNDKTIFGTADENVAKYTGQMRLLRNQYFNTHKPDKKAFYIFIIPSFIDSTQLGHILPYKAMGFVPFQQDTKKFSKQIGRTLAIGLGGLIPSWESGPPRGTTQNLMDDTDGHNLLYYQLDKLQNPYFYFSTCDAYEHVPVGNGTVAYYFWEEDEKGNILLKDNSFSNSIRRPFKKNFLAYRFNFRNILLRPFMRIGPYYISALNFIFGIGVLLLVFFLRKRAKRIWQRKNWRNFPRRFLFWLKLVGGGFLIYYSLGWGNKILDQFTQLSGPLPELSGLSYGQAKSQLFSNVDFRKQSEYGLSSEVLTHTGKNWQFSRLKKVLYFESKTDKNGKTSTTYKTNSDSLILRAEQYKSAVENHYVVHTIKDKDGKIEKQDVFDYSNKKIENIANKENIPRRVLVFVNGYRPTSSGQNFTDGFNGIMAEGLEYPNSSNFVYNFDRYDYWEQWGEINLQFQNKINPSVTFYADGHFSVSTSDYRSLISFTRASQAFPKRCKNPKKHVCWMAQNDNPLRFISPKKRTINIISRKANVSGFNYRKQKGKIAGRNVLQELNQYPGFSENDTLYLVAHSMGFAYAQGMIEVLRGKINFGGYYIVAPENAKSGTVKHREWQEIWQYGSRFKLSYSDAPCLQDGVAPQSSVSGLPFNRRVFLPKNLYERKGFFDSHFIGYYDWILKLQGKEKGYVQQR